MRPQRMHEQHQLRDVLALPSLLTSFASPRLLHSIADRYVLRCLQTQSTWTAALMTHTNQDATGAYARIRGEEFARIGGWRAHRLSMSAYRLVVQMAPDWVVEGSERGVRALLHEVVTAVDATNGNHALAWSDEMSGLGGAPHAAVLTPRLAALEDNGAPATLYYVSPEGGADLVAIVEDLDWIWGSGLGAAVEPFAQALRMLGKFDGARADMWENGNEMAARIVLAAQSNAAARRAEMALSFGRQIGRLAAGAAVRTGSMTAADAEVVGDVLESIESHVVEDLVFVRLRIQTAALVGPQ